MPPARSFSDLLGDETLLRPQARLTLRGDRASGYVSLLLALLGRSRLNRGFPDRRRFEALIRFLAPEGSHFLYDELEIGARTGLPTEPEITRVQADLMVAERVVRDEEARDPTLASDPVAPSRPEDDRYQRRYRYHRTLRESSLSPSFDLRARLRRAPIADEGALLTCLLDRFDLSEELFARYTVDLWYQPKGRSRIEIDGDRVEMTVDFRNRLARAAQHDSELAFLLLSEIPGVEVESVVRARIGPLLMAGLSAPPALQQILDDCPGELVISFPTDRTAVDIGADHSGDPLSMGYREFLSGASRAMVEAKRNELGFRIDRRRKFVCTAKVAPRLRAWLAQRGKPCVIYTVR